MPKIKSLIFLLLGIGLVVTLYFFVNLFSLFFCSVIVFCSLCFLGVIIAEKNIDSDNFRKKFPKLETAALNVKRLQAYRFTTTLLGISLLTIIYLISVFVLKKFQQPDETRPYFNNADHHAISNIGVAFNQTLVLSTNEKQGNANGLWSNESGAFKARKNSEGRFVLSFDKYFEPVFSRANSEEDFRPVNTIFPTPVQNSFAISNDSISLSCKSIETKDEGFLFKKKLRKVYHFSIRCSAKSILRQLNILNTYEDEIEVKDLPIEKGKSFYSLLIENDNFVSNKAQSKQVVERILQTTGEIYLLASPNSSGKEKNITIFPTNDFFKNRFILSIDGHRQLPELQKTTSLAAGDKFFIGFYNSRKQYFFSALDKNLYPKSTKTAVLNFDFPQYFNLSAQNDNAEIGTKQIRFLDNHYTQLLNSSLKEGFLFHEDLRNARSNIFSGTMIYTLNPTGVNFSGEVTDNFKNDQQSEVFGKNFSLHSQNEEYEWLFQIRDFADNGFNFPSNLMYLSILFLLFVFTLLFNANHGLERIEAVIYAVVYALLAYRFVLLWRVATFPPLENINKYELETTLIRFDFSFINFTMALPLTFILPAVFIILLNIYRFQKDTFSRLLAKMQFSQKKYLYYHSEVLIACSALLMLTGYDLITRIAGVFIPLLSYLFFSAKTNLQNQEKAFVYVQSRSKFLNYLHQFYYYLTANNEFYLTVSTFAFFAIFDRGFGVLFLLFLLLKNVFTNFLRKPYNAKAGSRFAMFWKPGNYWIYGIISFVIYVLFIGYKPLFYKVLIYRDIVLMIAIVLIVVYVYLANNKYKTRFLAGGEIVIALLLIPITKTYIDSFVEDQLKNVVHRASLIYQPVDELISENDYDSFRERKIVETAEGQWFINSYLNKTRNESKRIDFKPHFNRGVNYSTQTRDVVVPRYIIAEFGNWIIVWILVVLALPMIFYLIAYQLYQKDKNGEVSFAPNSYNGSVALILVFTLGFFVWLASTNRFVFFGQDFPFLSLTSKLSLLLPLTLFFIPLLNQPVERKIKTISPTFDFSRMGIFFVIIIIFLLLSGRSNNLQETNFQISLKKTEETINDKLNTLLNNIQDTVKIDNRAAYNQTGRIPQDLSKILTILINSKDYKELYSQSDKYSQSILDIIKTNPATTFKQDSPIYLRFDDDRYQSVYNKHLYLELPPYEDRITWKGNLYQQRLDSLHYPVMRIYNQPVTGEGLPYFAGSQGGTLKVAVLPNTWFANTSEPLVLMNLENAVKRTQAAIDIVSSQKEEILNQQVSGFVNKLSLDEIAKVSEGKTHFLVSYAKDNNYAFMASYWVNGKQRMVYPMGDKLFWTYHYSHALKTAYTADTLLHKDASITLDYKLNKEVGDTLVWTFSNKFNKTPNFKFAVIAADGDGKIRLMQDFVKNRTMIDPNNGQAIDKMNQRYFFFSNNKNERDQWGNTNLLHLAYGPGSSIKPLVFASLASRLNAGWENLILQASNQFELKPGDKKESVGHYAGYKLPEKKGWIDEHGEHFGNIDAIEYLRQSSNFYHSALMFLGSYTRNDFKLNETYRIQNVLSRQLNDPDNQFPALEIAGVTYRLKSLKDKAWPRSSKDESTYFGNEKSLLAEGLDKNLGLIVEDVNKTDFNIKDRGRVDYADTMVYQILYKQQLGGFLWSFPEQSFFIQAERKHANKLTNFFNGLKNPTLGGTPYSITPLKMTEMYGKLFSQNKDYQLYLTERNTQQSDWKVDITTWKGGFNDFLRDNVMKGMEQVMINGTAAPLLGGSNIYKGYYIYGKTGTIKEGEQNDSKRLALIISKNNLMEAPLKRNKFYTVYFTANEANNQEWGTYRIIIDQILESESFKNYMKE
jgi:transcriptional antiterminator Rof (Rho-off)